MVERKVSMVGSDQSQTEVEPNPDPGSAFLVHQELIMKNGILNIENLALDELAPGRGLGVSLRLRPGPLQGRDGLARPTDRHPLTSPSCR